jgi:hypothetical protein
MLETALIDMQDIAHEGGLELVKWWKTKNELYSRSVRGVRIKLQHEQLSTFLAFNWAPGSLFHLGLLGFSRKSLLPRKAGR